MTGKKKKDKKTETCGVSQTALHRSQHRYTCAPHRGHAATRRLVVSSETLPLASSQTLREKQVVIVCFVCFVVVCFVCFVFVCLVCFVIVCFVTVWREVNGKPTSVWARKPCIHRGGHVRKYLDTQERSAFRLQVQVVESQTIRTLH